MSRTPEFLLLRKEERQAREEQRRSPERADLDTALDCFVARYGAGDAAMWASLQAKRLMEIANPRSRRETRIAADRAFAQVSG